MRTITIPLSECDIELFKDIVYGKDKSLAWVFPFDNSLENVQITFIREEEEEDEDE